MKSIILPTLLCVGFMALMANPSEQTAETQANKLRAYVKPDMAPKSAMRRLWNTIWFLDGDEKDGLMALQLLEEIVAGKLNLAGYLDVPEEQVHEAIKAFLTDEYKFSQDLTKAPIVITYLIRSSPDPGLKGFAERERLADLKTVSEQLKRWGWIP